MLIAQVKASGTGAGGFRYLLCSRIEADETGPDARVMLELVSPCTDTSLFVRLPREPRRRPPFFSFLSVLGCLF